LNAEKCILLQVSKLTRLQEEGRLLEWIEWRRYIYVRVVNVPGGEINFLKS